MTQSISTGDKMTQLVTQKVTHEIYVWLSQERTRRVEAGDKRIKTHEILSDCIEAYKAMKSRTQ